MPTVSQKVADKEIQLAWPVKRWTFSHIKNLEYAIALLQSNSAKLKDPVIGYYMVTCLGTEDELHKVMSWDKAKEHCESDNRFRYETLESLLKYMKEINRGKYIIENGLILGLNPKYQTCRKSPQKNQNQKEYSK